MKRIISAEITNFQSHSHTIVNFKDGFNAIIGESDQGKTAILRAIKWVLYNKPNGKDFIRKGTAHCTVILRFDDGTTIERTRNVRENYYKITDRGGKEIHLEGFGSSVPVEVLQAHGMRLISLGLSKDSLNLSDQLDGPFLLKDTPNQRAMVVGRVARTEIVDKSIKDTMLDISRVGQKNKELNNTIIKTSDQLLQFAHLDNVKNIIDETEILINEVEAKVSILNKAKTTVIKLENEMLRRDSLEKILKSNEKYLGVSEATESLLDDFKSYSNIKTLVQKIDSELGRLNECNNILETFKDIDSIFEMIKELEYNINQYRAKSVKVSEIDRLSKEVERLKKIVSDNQNIDEIIESIDDCQQKLTNYMVMSNIHHKLEGQLSRKAKGVSVVEQIKTELNNVVTKYKGAIREAGKCPLCFSDVNEETLDNISNNLF